MYVCQICGYSTRNLEYYMEHLDYHISDENYAPEDEKWLRQERELMEIEEDTAKKKRVGTQWNKVLASECICRSGGAVGSEDE